MTLNDCFHCDKSIKHQLWYRSGKGREHFSLYKTWSLFDNYSIVSEQELLEYARTEYT